MLDSIPRVSLGSFPTPLVEVPRLAREIGLATLFPAGSVYEMMKHQVQVDVRTPVKRPGRALGLSVTWGLGWAIDSTMSGNIIYHSGANRSGFRCYSQFNYDQGSGIVIMTNGLNGSELWHQVVEKVGDF